MKHNNISRDGNPGTDVQQVEEGVPLPEMPAPSGERHGYPTSFKARAELIISLPLASTPLLSHLAVLYKFSLVKDVS